MPFNPRLTFAIAATGAAPVRFGVDASELGPIPMIGTMTTNHGKLLTGLASVLREPTDPTDAARLGTFALMVLCLHPLHGEDVRQCFAEALRTFDAITIAVVLDSDGIAFSIGDTGDTGDLRCRLANMEGTCESGQVGQWPTAQVAH